MDDSRYDSYIKAIDEIKITPYENLERLPSHNSTNDPIPPNAVNIYPAEGINGKEIIINVPEDTEIAINSTIINPWGLNTEELNKVIDGLSNHKNPEDGGIIC